jgi:hypothetical protein
MAGRKRNEKTPVANLSSIGAVVDFSLSVVLL